MNEVIEKYFCGQHSDDSLVKLSSQIQHGELTILELVEKLGPYLTNTDVENRIKACELLATVLHGLKNDSLSIKESTTLCDYLCSRLQDHYTLQPSVFQCLVEISKASNISDETVRGVIETIFKEVHVQSCLQNDRYKIFQILSNSFESHPSVICSMEKGFVCKYIESIDSEQDPRNLLIIFQLSADLIEHGLKFYNLEEEFFDVTSCYFPIDFNPSSSGKKTAITNEILVESLRRVISSTAAFSQFCIPLLIEKLESEIESAKLDSISTFVACLQHYGRSELVKFLPSILSTLRKEIIRSSSEKVEKESLNLLTKLVENISSWPASSSNTNLKSVLSEVLEGVNERLREPLQDKLTWSSSLIMLACARGSKSACSIVVGAVMPVLLSQTPNKSVNLQNLDNIVRLLTVASEFDYSVEDNPIMSHKEDLLTTFGGILSSDVSVQRKSASIAGYTSMLRLKILNEANLHELAHCFLNILLKNEEMNKVRSEVLCASSYFSLNYPHIVHEIMLPRFKELIDENSPASFKNGLECLAAISTYPQTLKSVASYVMSLLESVEVNEINQELISGCLDCLDSITKACEDEKVVGGLISSVAVPLIKLNVRVSINLQPEQCCGCCNKNNSESCVSITMLKLSSRVVRNLSQKVAENDSKTLIKTITSLFTKCDLTCPDIPASFNPFHPDNVLQSRTVCLLHASVGNFKNSIVTPSVGLEENLLELCLGTNDQFTCVSACKTLAVLVNKFPQSSDAVLDKILEVGNSPTTEVPNMNLVTLAIWVTKALALCNHGRTFDFVAVIFSMFKQEGVADIAAAGFDIILRESEEVFTSPSHSVIRLMHKQRFFLLVFPELLRGFHESREGNFFLTALSHLLVHLPQQVLLQELPELIPLLIQSMTSEEPGVLSSVLSTLYCLLQEAEEMMGSYIAALLGGFTKLATFKRSLDVRLKAIQCIGGCALLPTHIILPLKQTTIKGLSPAMDDMKRDVRAAAARAGSEWCLVGM